MSVKRTVHCLNRSRYSAMDLNTTDATTKVERGRLQLSKYDLYIAHRAWIKQRAAVVLFNIPPVKTDVRSLMGLKTTSLKDLA